MLRLIALTVKRVIKGRDIAARYGGEEIAIILPSTALQEALTVAERVRTAVTEKELRKRSTDEPLGRITVSIGVAELRRGESAHALIGPADKCLYAAKRRGRNSVVGQSDDGEAGSSTR